MQLWYVIHLVMTDILADFNQFIEEDYNWDTAINQMKTS